MQLTEKKTALEGEVQLNEEEVTRPSLRDLKPLQIHF
jgi:hypothetical protein